MTGVFMRRAVAGGGKMKWSRLDAQGSGAGCFAR